MPTPAESLYTNSLKLFINQAIGEQLNASLLKDERSKNPYLFFGQIRNCELAKAKRDALEALLKTIETRRDLTNDADVKNDLLKQIMTTQAALETLRKNANHPEGSTERMLHTLQQVIELSYTAGETHHLLNQSLADSTQLSTYYLKACMLYFVRRIYDEKTSEVLTRNPLFSPINAFHKLLDSEITSQIHLFWDIVNDLKPKSENRELIKNRIALSHLNYLQLYHNHLHTEYASVQTFLMPLPSYCREYIDEALVQIHIKNNSKSELDDTFALNNAGI